MRPLTLSGVGDAARAEWNRALGADADALISQTPAWMDCVTASGRYVDASRAYVDNDGHALVLPLARRRVLGAPAVLHSMPFAWGTGGLVSSRSVETRDVAAVVADLRTRQPALVVGVRPPPLATETWDEVVPTKVIRTHHMSQSVDLSGGFDEVWNNRFASTVRSHCRKAERRGVTVERDDTGRLAPVFDGLYRKSVDRWATQQHEPVWLARLRAARRDPTAKFRTVAERLGPACCVWIAWREGAPVAGMIVLTHGHHSTMWRAAIDKTAARGTGASELLHKMAFEEACRRGVRFFHLGDSAPGSPLARNKRGFGATELSYVGYRFERLPVTAADQFLRRQAKRAIRFRD